MDKEFDFNEIGKRMPYRVPETFFEDVQAKVLKRAGEEKKRLRIRRLWWGGSIALAVAAMLCGAVFFIGMPKEATQEELPLEWVAQNTTDAVELYLNDLTDDELQEWIEFSENDIYYELTTENLNEDEN